MLEEFGGERHRAWGRDCRREERKKEKKIYFGDMKGILFRYFYASFSVFLFRLLQLLG